MTTLAIIPAYNEEVAIGSVVLRAKAHVDEVLVVDDGSNDRTSAIAEEAGAKVLRHETNRGKGVALQAALDYARSNGFRAAVLLDADGQHDPDDIPRMLEPVLQGTSDLVVGLRYNGNTKMPFYRRVGKRTLDYATSAAGGALTDSQNGFRALSAEAMERLVLSEPGFGIESEMIVEAKEKNLRVSEMPVGVRYDVGVHTKQPFVHGFSVVDRILNIVAVRHPLFVFGGAGLALFAAGIVLGLYTLDIYNKTRAFAIGYALIVVIFLIVGGLSMFAGVILNVMPKVLDRNHSSGFGNHRPR